jgi:hypothetical protein
VEAWIQKYPQEGDVVSPAIITLHVSCTNELARNHKREKTLLKGISFDVMQTKNNTDCMHQLSTLSQSYCQLIFICTTYFTCGLYEMARNKRGDL